ncbi:MAG: ATP-binding cassette domain-containing protein [Myxococcota bacterium]|nr:ATP-binding cassette domain-containing protein [Myxococcota bacterium]
MAAGPAAPASLARPAPEAPVRIEGLNHFYGKGALRKQVLHEIDLEIDAGEIVILTGPSGSGKTTALTLIGALRSAQEGSLQVLGHELRGASSADLVKVRRRIGYIFQHHNLLGALSAGQNVQLSLGLVEKTSRSEARARTEAILDAVGLGDRFDASPGALSGGQKQRVAIARALVANPRMILADEPTASLDRRSGRDVVALMQRLAKEQGVTVVLVTHDNRILDVADRIVHLEDGRLTSFTDAVSSNTRQMMGLLAESNRKGELLRRVEDMRTEAFTAMLEQVTREAQEFVRITEQSSREAVESMLEQSLDAFNHKIVQVMGAEHGTLFLLDAQRGELWSKTSTDAGPHEIRIPRDAGIAGAVVSSGIGLNIPDAYEDPRFYRGVDEETGFRTRSILAVPLRTAEGEVFGVAELLNKLSGDAFDEGDRRRFEDLTASMSAILRSWSRLRAASGAPADGARA